MIDGIPQSPEAITFNGIMRATVINNVDPKGEGRIAVVILKMMPLYKGTEEPTPKDSKVQNTPDIVNNKEDNSFETSVQVVNFLWVRPTEWIDSSPVEKTKINNTIKVNSKSQVGTHQTSTIGKQLKKTKYVPGTGSYRVPRIGTTIFVMFEDGDPQKGYYLPYAPTLEGQVTPMVHVESRQNVDDMTKRPNIHVIREWQNGNILYADTNDETNTFVLKFSNGHIVKVEYNNTASRIRLTTETGHFVELSDHPNKHIRLRTRKGHTVYLNDNDGAEKIQVQTQAGHLVMMDDVADFVHIKTKSGSNVELNQGENINISTKTIVNVTAKRINFN